MAWLEWRLAPVTLKHKACAVHAPVLLNQLLSRPVQFLVSAARAIAPKLAVSVMQVYVCEEFSIRERLLTIRRYALELHIVQLGSELRWHWLLDEISLTIGTGALCVTLCPLADAFRARQSLAIGAAFRILNDLGAHHANEVVVERLTNSLVFSQLGVDARFRHLNRLILALEISSVLADQLLKLLHLLWRSLWSSLPLYLATEKVK